MLPNFTLERLLFVLPAIIVALTFHEFAHARVAYAFGDPTAKEAGRLSLNPLKHLDPLGTLLLLVAGFGWAKPVPINPQYFGGRRNRKIMAVSVAGPLMNLLQALLGAAALALMLRLAYRQGGMPLGAAGSWLISFLAYFVQINIVLAIFNLLPIPPLDGSKILAGILPRDKMFWMFSLERNGFILLLLLLFLPELLGLFGLPRFNIMEFIIIKPANWVLNGMFSLFGL